MRRLGRAFIVLLMLMGSGCRGTVEQVDSIHGVAGNAGQGMDAALQDAPSAEAAKEAAPDVWDVAIADAPQEAAPDAWDAAIDEAAVGLSCGLLHGEDVDSGIDPGSACTKSAYSDLDGVSIRFPDQPCVFTLAEAAAGIVIQYELVVENKLQPGVNSRPSDPGCCATSKLLDGFYTFERVFGHGQNYCLCELGKGCAPPGGKVPSNTPAGVFPQTFSWPGVNWNGPSDSNVPYGSPFPPGRYTLKVSTRGYKSTGLLDPFEVASTIVVELVP